MAEALELSTTKEVPHMGRPGQYYFKEGEETIHHEDLSIPECTLSGLVEYIRVRKDAILTCNKPLEDDGAHITFQPTAGLVKMVLREHGSSNHNSDLRRTPSTLITASVRQTEDAIEVHRMLEWSGTVHELAIKLRKLRHLFKDGVAHKELVNTLRGVQHKVERIIDDTSNDLGARKKGYEEEIINAKPIEFEMTYPFYEGEKPMSVTMEVIYQVTGGEVKVSLLALDLVHQERELKEAMVQHCLAKIREHLGDALPIMRMN